MNNIMYRIKKIIMILIVFSIFMLNFNFVSNAALDNGKYYPNREVWKPNSGTNMNISHYVYYDNNKNGIYDIGDTPLSHFAIKMTRPDGTSVVRRSNLNGFTNFTHSYTDSPVDVSEPGEYTLEIIVPKGWKVTSNNKTQKINYRIGKIERSSLVADKVPIPIGVIQEPSISGSVKNSNNNLKNIEILAKSPKGNLKKINYDDNGFFKINGEYANDYGVWEIKVLDKETKEDSIRKVELKNKSIKMSTINIGEVKPSKKENKQLIDFEDITHSTIQKIPNGVGGIDWYNLLATDFLVYKGEGYVNNKISGKYIGYNTSGQPVTLSNKDGFDFYGGYFGVAWRRSSEGETLEVKAYRGDKLIDKQEFKLSALGPFYFDADYRNITKLELKTKHYWQFVTDDMLLGTD